jgi:hypothetical protein
MNRIPVNPDEMRCGPDWRGWVALGWVLAGACAYALMAVQARAPQVVSWLRSLTPGR